MQAEHQAAPEHPLDQLLGEKYAALGGCAGLLGKALSTAIYFQSPTLGAGSYTGFEGGDIHQSPHTDPPVVLGAIRDAWTAAGDANGPLGFPTSDELTTPDTVGRYNHFQGGSVYFTPHTGAHEIYGAIAASWAAQGYEVGPLGYPTTGEFAFLFGRVNIFQRRFILLEPLDRSDFVALVKLAWPVTQRSDRSQTAHRSSAKQSFPRRRLCKATPITGP